MGEKVIKNYKDLIVWQKSMNLVMQVYKLTNNYPRSEIYGLVSQIRRAAISIPSNIAEGRSRSTRKDFRKFLIQAYASLSELETQMEISLRLGYLDNDNYRIFQNMIEELNKMLGVLISKLK